MIRLTDKLWIGDSYDERWIKFADLGIGAVLCVARDMETCGRPDETEYMQVGLVDGPGNLPAAYCAAVLALASLLNRHRTLVCCHSGSRSLAVAVMYLNAPAGHNWPGDWSPSWDGWMARLRASTDTELPAVHDAHREAFDKMDWRAIASLMGE